LISAFILWHLGNLFVEGLPSQGVFHERLQAHQGWYLNTLGQWQGSLAFFAPEPLKDSVQLHADLSFVGGKKVHWSSPNWEELSLTQKFLACRLIKFYDNLRMDQFSAAWDGFSQGLGHLLQDSPANRLDGVVLTRVWSSVPAPESAVYNPWKLPPVDNSYQFFHRNYE
jgi:hypothetical protein